MASELRKLYTVKKYHRGTPAISCFSFPSEGTAIEENSFTVGRQVLDEHDNPRWRWQVAHGKQATTSFIARDVHVDYSPGYFYARKWCNGATSKAWSTEQWVGNFFGAFVTVPNDASSGIDTSVDALALASFVRRARAIQGTFRGATFLAELAETLTMLRNPARAIRRGIDVWSKNARKVARKAAGRNVPLDHLPPSRGGAVRRALSESWLEHSYGWLPLGSDVADAGKSLKRFADREDLVRVSATETLVGPFVGAVTTRATETLSMRLGKRSWSEASVRYYGAVKVNATGGFLGSTAEEFGFRIRDFIPAIWEAIPYSFLVDYFTNIGAVIESWSFPTSDMAWVAKTYRNTNISRSIYAVDTTNSPTYPASNAVVVEAFYPSSLTFRNTYVARQPYFGSLVAPLRFKIPGMSTKWINIAALASVKRLF